LEGIIALATGIELMARGHLHRRSFSDPIATDTAQARTTIHDESTAKTNHLNGEDNGECF